MNLPMLIKLSSIRKGDNMAAALDEAQAGRQIHQRRQPASEQQMNALSPEKDQIIPGTSHHQQARPARARLGQIRPDGRASTPRSG
jgi:hypothetical protein